MSKIEVRDLDEGRSFGARVTGVTRENITDDGVRERLRAVFEDRGLIVFEEIEPTSDMQLALSAVYGPLQDHQYKNVPQTIPGVVNFDSKPADKDILAIDGKELSSWVPWHFDACYTAKLNRAGLLRPLVIPPEGGYTGFADGIQLYNAISPELRERFRDLEIVYHPWLVFMNLRFGKPKDFRVVNMKPAKAEMIEANRNAPRAVHPAIWRRPSGEHVLHVSPWQADGIFGHEDPEGEALLNRLCDEMLAKMDPYFHQWRPTDMVLWDNWRMLHSCTGHNPAHPRHMHRSTIDGDYGLGRFEDGVTDREPVEAME